MSTSTASTKAVPLPPWSELPEELLELVLKDLSSFSDFIRFRSVCKEWQSLAKPRDLPIKLPLLMLPYLPLADARSFFCPTTGKSFEVSLPELVGNAVLASSFGWMVLLDIDTMALSLLNPVNRAKIELPSTDGFHQLLDLCLDPHGNGLRIRGHDGVSLGAIDFGTLCRWEVSLSSSPTSAGEDCFVVVSDTFKVYFCKPRDAAWSSVSHHGCRSAVYHDSRLFVMGANAEMSIFDANTLSKLKTIPSPVATEKIYRYFNSLAKNNSLELIMFAGNPNIVYERDPFEIFKMDVTKKEEELEWTSCFCDLHEMSFYWSMKQCMAVNGGVDFPASMQGRIYFNGAPYKPEANEPCHEISICCIKDGDSKIMGCGGVKPSEKMMKPVWVWVTLSL